MGFIFFEKNMRENLIQNWIINYLQLKENLWELYFFRSWTWAVKIQGENWRDRFFKTWKPGTPDITVCKNWKMKTKWETKTSWRKNKKSLMKLFYS